MILKGEVRSQSLIYLNIWAAMALMEAIGKQVPPPPWPHGSDPRCPAGKEGKGITTDRLFPVREEWSLIVLL